MRLQTRFIRLILIGAVSVSICGCTLASVFYERTVAASNSATFAGVVLRGTALDLRQEKAPQVNPPLPDDVLNTELKALDGSSFKLADYRGKVLVVNLWASWCGPCRSEVVQLDKISHEFGTRSVEVIGLTTEDPESDQVKVKDFVKEFGITYRIGWVDQSFALALMQGQVKNNIPQSFIISRNGRVVKRFVGFSQVETPPKMRQALEEALNEW